MNPDFTLIWPLSCPKDGDHFSPMKSAATPTIKAATTTASGKAMKSTRAPTGDGNSRLTLTHTAHVSDFWTEYGPGAVGVGWELGLFGLALHLAQPDATKMDESAFSASPEGKAMATGISERWGHASIAAGTDAEEALEAARRTTAFYTGEASETP